MSGKTLFRVIILLIVTLVLMMLGRHTWLAYYFDLHNLTHAVMEAGHYGTCIFIIIYVVGTLMNIPGVLFLLVLFMVLDPVEGFIVGYLSTLLSMVVHFLFTRFLAGEALSEIKQPFIRKQVSKLTEKPIQTTVILRLIFFISPPVNYALALSSVRFRDFLLGSMISMPVNLSLNYALYVFAKSYLVEWLT